MGTILEPSLTPPVPERTDSPLVKEMFLGEFSDDDEKSVVRENLGVYATDEVYSKEEADALLNSKLTEALKGYVTSEQLPAAVQELREEIEKELYVKADGSVPFTNPQSQSALPTKSAHLANRAYVDSVLLKHLASSDPHKIIDKVKVILADYVKSADVYAKSSLYNRNETDKKLASYVKADGTTPFTQPQMGKDPVVPGHLATGRYVKNVMEDHKAELDPHGFRETLRRNLSNYYTKSETYTKAQTYSRNQLFDIIKGQMKDAIDQALAVYNAENGSVTELRDWVQQELMNCIKHDGSVAHSKPQTGVPAESDSQFIVLSQLNETVKSLDDSLRKLVEDKTNQTVWVTSGPVRSTVGFVEDNTLMPARMTVQQVCDAIFYGRQIGVVAPPYAEYNSTVCIKIYTHGLGMLDEVDIYKNGKLVGTLHPSDFTDACEDFRDDGAYYRFCDPDPFTEDVEWEVKFRFSDCQEMTDKAETKLSYPIFIGALPHWWNAQEDITIASLRQKAEEDPENCRFYTLFGPDIRKLPMKFDFVDKELRDIVVVIPQDYPDLLSISTHVQATGSAAFARWLQPLHPNDKEEGVLYKIYVFSQALVKLDRLVWFRFGKEEEDDE